MTEPSQKETKQTGELFERVFETVVAPLVLGGTLHPGKPIGARAAIALCGWTSSPTNSDVVSRVQLVRVRRARSLTPIGHMDPPAGTEIALGAILHDIIQSTHPGFASVFRKNTPNRILGFAESALARISPAATVSEALLRHTVFARTFALERKDVVVRWWTGSATFLGEEPSARLLAWPEVRRVHQQTTERGFDALPETASVDKELYERALRSFTSKTPLTDWAHCNRAFPAFRFTAENLGLIGSRAGKTLVLRALAKKPSHEVDPSLGRAMRLLVEQKAWQALSQVTDLLAERALLRAEVEAGVRNAAPRDDADKDAVFARCTGALVAKKWLAEHSTFRPSELRAILAVLDAEVLSPAATEVRELFG